MTTIAEFKDELYNWATLISGREVIFQNVGEGPIRNSPHVMLFVQPFQDLGIPSTVLNQTTDEIDLTSENIVTVAINVFWGDALAVAKQLSYSLWIGNRTDDIYKVSGLDNVREVIDLTEIKSGAFVPRAQFEVAFSVQLEYTEAVPYFLEVEAQVDGETITVQGT